MVWSVPVVLVGGWAHAQPADEGNYNAPWSQPPDPPSMFNGSFGAAYDHPVQTERPVRDSYDDGASSGWFGVTPQSDDEDEPRAPRRPRQSRRDAPSPLARTLTALKAQPLPHSTACRGKEVHEASLTTDERTLPGSGPCVAPDVAVARYKRACTQGSARGCARYGGMLHAGVGLPKDDAAAAVSFTQACDRGALIGCAGLAELYLYGHGRPKDVARGVALLHKACNGNLTRACVHLGEVYEAGDGTDADVARATALYQRACNRGNGDGCVDFGALIERTTKVPAKAVAVFRQACDRHLMIDCVYLAARYFAGTGVEQDNVQAALLDSKACDAGESAGCNDLGVMYGEAGDSGRAVALYKLACDGDLAYGCANYGWMLENGAGVAANLNAAVAFYKRGCDGDAPLGCSNLARLHQTGMGVAFDLKRAFKLHKRACDGGATQSCGELPLLRIALREAP
jgi:TPR repeat protein